MEKQKSLCIKLWMSGSWKYTPKCLRKFDGVCERRQGLSSFIIALYIELFITFQALLTILAPINHCLNYYCPFTWCSHDFTMLSRFNNLHICVIVVVVIQWSHALASGIRKKTFAFLNKAPSRSHVFSQVTYLIAEKQTWQQSVQSLLISYLTR